MLFILDRDGVINYESDVYVKSPAEWIPIPGSLEAIARLNHAGHTVVVATNQAGVGRGIYTLEMMHAINDKMLAEVAKLGGHIEKVYYCPHHPDDKCACRKPEPGMLLEIKKNYPSEFDGAVFIGDSIRDVDAGRAVGLKLALVKTGNGMKSLESPEKLQGVLVCDNLASVVDSLLLQNV